jgi:hypothetical protein
MAGLQTIINKAEAIEFNRRKVVGIQYSRNEIAFRNETVTKNPWRLNVKFPAYLPYASNRDLTEALDTLDRRLSETVTFANISWMFAYQGAMSTGQRSNITITSFQGNQLVLGNVFAIDNNNTADKLLFKAGDIIQVVGRPYPFTVTEDVARGNDASVTVTTHRPNFISTSVVGLSLNYGNDVQFKLFCPNMPTYSIIPGRYIVFNDSFQLYEDVGAA